MVRAFKRRRYILAAALTLTIFLLGLMLGLVIESKRVAYVQDERAEQELDYSSLQLQYLYIDQLGQENNCDAVVKTFDRTVTDLERARTRLEEYSQRATVNRQEFELLQRDYTLAQIRYWLLARKTKNLCNTEFSTILYFFAPDEMCDSCNEQAFILTYLKKRMKDKLLNFVIMAEQEEPMVDILKTTYNITKYPTLVIGDKKFSGFTPRSTILQELCREYTSEIEDCEPYR